MKCETQITLSFCEVSFENERKMNFRGHDDRPDERDSEENPYEEEGVLLSSLPVRKEFEFVPREAIASRNAPAPVCVAVASVIPPDPPKKAKILTPEELDEEEADALWNSVSVPKKKAPPKPPTPPPFTEEEEAKSRVPSMAPGEEMPIPTTKVYIAEKLHKYMLREKEVGFPGYMLSASKALGFARAVLEGRNLDEYFEPFEITEIVQREVPYPAPFVRRLTSEQKEDGEKDWEGTDLGAALHHYNEHRVWGFTLVPHDYGIEPQVLQFERMLSKFPPNFFCCPEFTLGSFNHKFCGKIDVLHKSPVTGKFVVFDWKRDKGIFEKNKRYHTSVIDHPGFSKRFYYSETLTLEGVKYHVRAYHVHSYSNITMHLFGYFVQPACYRKLGLLNGMPMSDTLVLAVFDPKGIEEDAGRGLVEVKLLVVDLTMRCPQYGNYSPIQVAQWIFDERKRMLKQKFGLKQKYASGL